MWERRKENIEDPSTEWAFRSDCLFRRTPVSQFVLCILHSMLRSCLVGYGGKCTYQVGNERMRTRCMSSYIYRRPTSESRVARMLSGSREHVAQILYADHSPTKKKLNVYNKERHTDENWGTWHGRTRRVGQYSTTVQYGAGQDGTSSIVSIEGCWFRWVATCVIRTITL